jgi:hypothetical protein
MLPPDGPFLEPALALSALPFRPVTAGVLPAYRRVYFQLYSQKVGVCVMPGARQITTPRGGGLFLLVLEGTLI